MLENNTLEKIKKYPVQEKIEIIETILESLKTDIGNQIDKTKYVPFKVKKINLGQEIDVDRDELYAERG